jgi:hypothetical protein
MRKIYFYQTALFLIIFMLSFNSLFSQGYTEIVTDTSWNYQNSSGNWVKANLGTQNAAQIASVSANIGLGNDNMIWGGTSVATTVKKTFQLPIGNSVDSIRFWIQGDDSVTNLKINGTIVGHTPFGWNNFTTGLISKSLINSSTNTILLTGDNSNGSLSFVAMKLRIYHGCQNKLLELVTDTSWQYQNTSNVWVNANLGSQNSAQVSIVQSNIGLGNDNMIWGGTSVATTVKKTFQLPIGSTIDSARFWIQGDDNVTDLKLNSTSIGSTPFGWNNFTTGLISKSLINTSSVNTLLLSGDNSNGSLSFVAMKMKIYYKTCPLATNSISTNTIVNKFILNQNYPNPFIDKTTIGYYMATKSNNAIIKVFDIQGKVIKTIQLPNIIGERSVDVEIIDLSGDIFLYSLIIDGNIIETKRMKVSK